MSETDRANKQPNKYLIYLAIFLSALSFIVGIITRDIWPILILISATIYLHRNKPKTKEEENVRDNATIASYSIILLFPVGLIFIFLCYLLFANVFSNILNSF